MIILNYDTFHIHGGGSSELQGRAVSLGKEFGAIYPGGRNVLYRALWDWKIEGTEQKRIISIDEGSVNLNWSGSVKKSISDHVAIMVGFGFLI